MKVLLAVDDSEFPRDLLQAVVNQFRSETTDVLVLHILQQIGSAIPEMASGYAPEMEGEGKMARVLVHRIASELHSTGFKADAAVEVGDVKNGIIDAATQWGADLILLGSHGRRGIARVLLGSTAEFIARHARCSVEIVRFPKNA